MSRCNSMHYIMWRCSLNRRIVKLAMITMGINLLVASNDTFAQKEEIGLPACEQIVGVDRNIEIGNTVSYTIEYLEKNNYRCDAFKGNAEEIISCTYRLDRRFEVLLTVEDGMVTEIETLQDGMECSYFNVKPSPPDNPDDSDDKTDNK